MSQASEPEARDAVARPLSGQVALVTGGSGGIGRAIATGLGEAGARVAIADRTPFEGGSAPGNLPERREYILDLLDTDAAGALPQRVLDDLGSLDVVVNNAGRRGIF